MARRKNTQTEEQQQKSKDEGLILTELGTVTEERQHTPRITDVTPDGRIRRIDY